MTYKEFKKIFNEYSFIQKNLKLMRKPSNFDKNKLDEIRKNAKNLKIISYDISSNNLTEVTYYLGKHLRYLNIAWSIFKGKTYDQIERPRENNILDEYAWKKINEYKSTIESVIDKRIEIPEVV